MKKISSKFKNFLFLIILVLLILPVIRNQFEFIKPDILKGDIVSSEKPQFNLDGWFSGEYQSGEEKFLNESFGFRSFFIRINNQIAFTFFNKAKANGVIIGKDNYLFEENYIKAYYGTDFVGIDSITQKIQKLKFIQDTLSKLNKTLVVVFAAGKGSFYPEYFPDHLKKEKGNTNYENYVKLAKDYGLNYIDFNKYFVENKNTSIYPLYPQYGIHWSNYGACIAADSMIRYIEKKRNIDMPNLYWNNVEMSDAKESDYDIGDGMNLLFHLKSFQMAYPIVQIQSDLGKVKPSAIVISDSFYWLMFGNTFTKALSDNHFWFYNKQVYPDFYNNGLETSKVNIKDEISNHDVIVIMATEATLPKLGWGFIEKAYDAFKGVTSTVGFDPVFQQKVIDLSNYIKTDENWMKDIRKKAIEHNVSVDSMVTIDAIWQIQNEKK